MGLLNEHADTIDDPPTNAQAVAEIVAKLHEPTPLVVATPADGSGFAIAVPKGINLVSTKKFIDEYRTRPERREGTAKLGDLESFIAHTNRFKDAGSVIFASDSPRSPSLTSVLDYHEDAKGQPRFGKHRGHYAFPLSEEWRRWIAAGQQKMTQAQFAEFIEENIVNIVDPLAALDVAVEFAKTMGTEYGTSQRLMEMSRGLKIRVTSHVQNAVTLSSGESQFLYTAEHQDERGQPLKVPGACLVGLRVFQGGAHYQVPVRIRYRTKDGEITWSLDLQRVDATFEDAFNEAKQRVREETALPLFVGTPEA
jgi:uncharacterized protein YfdQ (DUF2303 family)